MKNKYQNIAVVVLNYMIIDETRDLLKTLYSIYPEIKTIIIDNGSSDIFVEELIELAKKYNNIEVYHNKTNLGFARGNNIGIEIARLKGYKYIICSNSDILFNDPLLLERLRYMMEEKDAAIIGPRVVNLKGQNQNPLLFSRPGRIEVSKILFLNSFSGILLRRILSDKGVGAARQIVKYFKKKVGKELDRSNSPGYVYALSGAFLMFGPKFFEFYNGFYDGTFLYGEELIIGEMLYQKNLKAWYEPSVYVVHKEDRTNMAVFRGQERLKPLLYARQSVRLWYKLWKQNNHQKYREVRNSS